MSRTINAIIVDDEEFARENLRIFIEDFCPEIHVMQMAANAREARQQVEELNPDLVFLDIMMPGDDGFSFLNGVEDRRFAVIFTTAHNEFALKAIKENAVDYLEKPINIEELQTAVKKAVDIIELQRNAGLSDERIGRILQNIAIENSVEKTTIPTRDGMAIVKNSEIIHLEASESYTTIYLTGGRKFLSSKTIKTYELKLDERMFFRTHKSHIINISHHLREFNRSAGNVAVMSNDIEVPISRRKLHSFLERVSSL
jgi:two-component system LytT family response regulator